MNVSRPQVLKWGAVGGVSLTGLDAIALEPRSLSLQAFEYPVRGLGKAYDGYRLAFITDIHYPRHITRAFIQKAQDLALEFRPDVLLWGGDFVDGRNNRTEVLTKVPSLANLFDATAPDGVYGVLGNHDWWLGGPNTRREIERSTPIQLLENAHVVLSRGDDRLVIGGIEDLWKRYPNLDIALGGAPPEVPRILLSHNPDAAEVCPGEARVDLQLSGHTHGGEVSLPFFGPPAIPSKYGQKFARGLVQAAKHPVYVSVGIASPRGIRFNCRPEVTGIILRSA